MLREIKFFKQDTLIGVIIISVICVENVLEYVFTSSNVQRLIFSTQAIIEKWQKFKDIQGHLKNSSIIKGFENK